MWEKIKTFLFIGLKNAYNMISYTPPEQIIHSLYKIATMKKAIIRLNQWYFYPNLNNGKIYNLSFHFRHAKIKSNWIKNGDCGGGKEKVGGTEENNEDVDKLVQSNKMAYY